MGRVSDVTKSDDNKSEMAEMAVSLKVQNSGCIALLTMDIMILII